LTKTNDSTRALDSRASLAIIAVSRRGAETARRVAAAFPDAVAFVPQRFATDAPEANERIRPYEGKVRKRIAALFEGGVPLVLVMAAGAAVRLIAPSLRDKNEDPPVVVVDDSGRYAISLLSGHTGGANRLAREIADTIGAQAIVTTASDSAGLPAIDEIARALGWWIEPESNLTRLAAALINGDSVGVYQDAGSGDWLVDAPERLQRYTTLDALSESDPSAGLVISDRVVDLPAALAKRTVICRPPVLVLGIGCSSGAGRDEIEHLVDGTLAAAGLSPLAAFAVATLDRKQDEPGLVAFTNDHRLQLMTYGAAELEKVQGTWTASEVVRQAVGTGGVAEPAALACAGVSNLLVRKVKSKHVTLAVARIPSSGSSAKNRTD
jgi:cobalamin biosynthesis protein CbiG